MFPKESYFEVVDVLLVFIRVKNSCQFTQAQMCVETLRVQRETAITPSVIITFLLQQNRDACNQCHRCGDCHAQHEETGRWCGRGAGRRYERLRADGHVLV